MSIDGNWEIDMQSPAGKQTLYFELASNGGELVGALTGTEEKNPQIMEGKVDGNEASWRMRVTKPMPIKLKFSVTIDGDKLDGKVKPGLFPAFPIVGRRV